MFKFRLISVSRRLLLVLAGQSIALALSLAPAFPLDSGWAETEGGRMRLVIDPVPRDDEMIAGFLDIELAPGWKTYWRDPGSAGIPPTLDFSENKGVAFLAMDYPAPVRVDDGYAIWAGYTAPVRFPLTFQRTASGDAQIHARAFIGICEKICVPFQADLVVDLPADPAGATLTEHNSIRQAVDAAFARLPESAGPDFSLETVLLDREGMHLTISAKLPAFRPSGVDPELFVAGPDGFAFAPPKLTRDEGGQAEWTVRVDPPSGMAEDSDALPLDIVVTLGQRAIGQSISADPAAKN
ncbi:protein-disulfide reductase DsbD domain-containing protein [Hoeflea sp. AS16]|uniref:protein-disulfide reductase DsbD domain-containing protein n=1 Tax=Hoeflea sp. AS16 TaxID=3135779 RepID=UPI00316FF6B4